MSGFEVAGAVLAAFPIALIALEEYREVARRLDRFHKIRLEYKKCRDTLKYHQLSFTRHLRQLLLPLLVDDDKIDDLLSAPGGDGWKEPSVANLLRSRLLESYELYLDLVTEMKRVLDHIHKELAADSEPVQQQINASKDQKGTKGLMAAVSADRWAFRLYRLKFSNRETVLTQLFAELQEINNKLEKLLNSGDQDTYLIDMAVCNFWVQARSLLKALAAAWNCGCPEHAAKLLLQHRTNQNLEVQFQVTFTNSMLSCWDIWKTRISDVEDAEDAMAASMQESAPVRNTHRQARQLRRARRLNDATTIGGELLTIPPIPSSCVQASTHVPLTRPISNLCVTPSQPEGMCCGYILNDNCRYYVYTIARHTTDTFSFKTLDQVLRGEVLPQPKRVERYTLALTVASSFLQLLDSGWLPNSFNKTNILFVADADNPTMFLLDQPHINRVFDNPLENADMTSAERGSRYNDSLDRLGIMLLELCFGKTLEEQPCRKEWRAGENEKEKEVFDVGAAREWQCHVNGEAGPDYAEAVGWCLGGNRAAPPDRWRQDMLRNVVQPLKRSCDYLTNGGAEGS
ncbi:hypothetical protein QBC33DRAFT_613156 [Phialemonium atrogriseum]|uniref:DUF7580 domain-containing protein n=1 Tax=Phialemonium atrogriseum TaxID=1093897 RepID=A0AAJ0BUJ2_9PEZI|nr:uncharacterized protein QBC33DRAFT_613156 [Phialemonium atrogriseum]KAK1764491.1 hypothetical protein QBC33DRAFT_613156 [Phialemonium atrogriseum]